VSESLIGSVSRRVVVLSSAGDSRLVKGAGVGHMLDEQLRRIPERYECIVAPFYRNAAS